MQTAHSASNSSSIKMAWVHWVAWACAAVVTSVVLEYLAGWIGASTAYNLTGSTRECFYLGTNAADAASALALGLSIFMHGSSGRRPFWAGIVVTQFVRHIPAIAVLAWSSAAMSIEVVDLHYSAYLWWPLRAIVAAVAFIWLCMKRERPSWSQMALLGLTSSILLALLMHWGPPALVSPLFLWRIEALWGVIAP